jgi:IclR family acetate operon transcriptional repressor
MAAGGASNPVKSAMRTLDVIEYVVANRHGVVAQEIAAALAIPVSSLSYLLGTLADREYLVRDGRRYLPGPGLDRLRAPQGSLSLADRVTPLVRAVKGELNETASFIVRHGWEIEAVVTEASDHALRYAVEPGMRRPMHALSAGKVLLAALSEADLARYFAEVQRDALTARTRCSEADLRADVARIRSDGYCIAREEATAGIVGISIAVVRGSDVLGSFSVAVPVVRLDEALEGRAIAALRRAAEGLS